MSGGAKQVGDFAWDNSGFLGEGSYGKVYKGKNVKTGEFVAVKCMDMSAFTDRYMKDALETEIEVMRELKSENVVRMFHVEISKKMTYIVLELCNGGDLRKHIHSHGGHLSEQISLQILNQLMVGFKELIDHGYIHRDIKPENTLIKNKTFKVADFGFACKADISGRKLIKECVGTPLYMAPQLLENTPYSAKSDLWSIGLMYYEMLFGKTPWPARDVNSYLRNIKAMPLRFPYDKPIGKHSKDFISKCLTSSERMRMSWEDAFKHPVLQNNGGQQDTPAIQLDSKAKEVIRSMQQIVQTRGLNTEQIFQRFDADGGGVLSQSEFNLLLASIDPRITSYESNHVFGMVDSSKDGSVSLTEFKAIFNQWDFCDINDPATNVITELKEIIKNNKLHLKDIFINFDADKQGTLDENEFVKLVRIVGPRLKDYEITPIFKKFDVNNDGTISFEEFQQALAYGIAGEDKKFNPKGEKVKKLLTELKRIIAKHGLNLRQIFTNFDKSRDGRLEISEFSKLLKVIDKNLPDEEIIIIFEMFAKGDSFVTFEEFTQGIAAQKN